jgi:iron complex outermembrane receptor protein
MTVFSTGAARVFGASLIALAIASTTPALAQDAVDQEARLADIVVTAQKREESLADVPSSVATLGGEKLLVLNSGASDYQFLSARVPSLIIESSSGRVFPRAYIRGLGNTDFDLNASQPVSFVYDQVVFENPVLKGFPLFDIEQVEVLRGPQGTLFGRNTPAGILKFDSKKPTRTPEVEGSASYGNYATYDVRGVVSGPLPGELGKAASMRLSLLFQGNEDYVDNMAPGPAEAFGDYREIAGRLQFLLEPSDDLSVLLNLHARKQASTSQFFRANIIRPGTGGIISGFDREQIALDSQNGQNVALETVGATVTINKDYGDVTLTSVTGYESVSYDGVGDIDGGFGAVFAPPFGPGFIPFDAETRDGISDHSQFTQEVRLASDTDLPYRWQVGAYFFKEDLSIYSINYATLFGGGINGLADQRQQTDAWALFGSVDHDLTDALTLSVGLRYSDDSKTFVGERQLSPLSFLGVGPIGPLEANVSDASFSGDISLRYTVNTDTNVYGRFARGFRAPSIQGRVLFGDVVSTAESEFVSSLEGGVKSSLMDGKARVNASVYYYQIDDQQLTAIGGAGNFNQLINAEKTIGYGFEVDAEYLPTEALLLTAGLSYNSTEIQDPGLEVAPCGAPCTVLDPVRTVGTVRLANIDGNSLPNAPEWIGNVTARYSIPLGAHGELFAFTDWAYKGETNFFLYESAEFREDGYWEGGLRVGYLSADGKKEIAVFGRNILDETRLIGGIDFNNLTGFVNNPRIYGLEVKGKF